MGRQFISTMTLPKFYLSSVAMVVWTATSAALIHAQDALPPYKNPNLPVEVRVQDLIGRMTVEEKARQLDMYPGCEDFIEKSQTIDQTHAKADAMFDQAKAENALGHLGAGSIHDLYPYPELYNAIQSWVIKSNPLGIQIGTAHH